MRINPNTDQTSSEPRVVKLFRHHGSNKSQSRHSSTTNIQPKTIIHTVIGLPGSIDVGSDRTTSTTINKSVERSQSDRFSVNVRRTSRPIRSHSQSNRSLMKSNNGNNNIIVPLKSNSLNIKGTGKNEDIKKERTNSLPNTNQERKSYELDKKDKQKAVHVKKLSIVSTSSNDQRSINHLSNIKQTKQNGKINKYRFTSTPVTNFVEDSTQDTIQIDDRSISRITDRLPSRMKFSKESREELNKKTSTKRRVAGNCCGCSRLCIFFSILAVILVGAAIAAALIFLLNYKSTTTTKRTPTTTKDFTTISTTTISTTTLTTVTSTTTSTTTVSTTTLTTTSSSTTSTSTTFTTTSTTTSSSTTSTTTSSTTTSTTETSTTSSSSTTSTSTTETSSTTSTTETSTSTSTTETSSTTSTTETSSTASTTTDSTTTITTDTTLTSTTSTTTTTTLTYVPTGIYALQVPPCAKWNKTGVTVAGNFNGDPGNDTGSLDTPVSIFIDNNYTLYVCDRENHRITKYVANSIIGIIVAGTGIAGNSATQLNEPKGVAVDQMGAIIVADSSNYRIQRFTLGSLVGTTIASNRTSSLLGQTRDLHIDVNNAIYVTDSDYSRVVKYFPYDPIGVVLAGSAGQGTAANQLDTPYGNFMDGDGTLYIADYGNHRVQKWLAGATSGTTVAGVTNVAGSDLFHLDNPRALVVDNNGYVYIVDSGNHRIVRWTNNYAAGGTCLINCSGTQGSGAAKLQSPRDIKFDASGNIYVSDQGNNRIQKYEIQYPPNCTAAG